jgi:DNA mismatch repair protein MutS
VYASGKQKLTPVMLQYRDAKEAYPDAILFFRLGDFYEMFNDDAVVAAEELQLTLTSRNKGSEDEVPMAGVPVHAAHNYLSKLLVAGHKVAICEQIGDPSKIKGIVPRKVVRVLTPGLLTDDDQLDARRNNYLCSVDDAEAGDDRYGIALLDLSTGELSAGIVEGKAMVVAEIARAEPSETLLPRSLSELRNAVALAVPKTPIREDGDLAEDAVRPNLDESVARPLYEDAVASHPTGALRAAARALRFATHYLPDTTLPVRRIARHAPDAVMRIDETAQTHLELLRGAEGTKKGSLLDVVDATVTPPGARRLRRQLVTPLLDVAGIRRRLDAVELFLENPRAREELRGVLRQVGDLERLAVRASLREASPRDLRRMATSLEAAPQALAAIRSIAALATDGLPPEDTVLALDVDLLEPLRQLLNRALVDEPPAHTRDGGMIREGFDGELDELRALRKSGTELLSALESRYREETQIGSLKVKYTRAFGWYIEVTKAHLDKVPDHWRRRQTLTASERYLDDELEELADKLGHAEERYDEREARLFSELVDDVAKEAEPLRFLAAAIAQWDVSSALAEIAHRHDYVRPEIDESERLELIDARHPVVERYVPTGQFVPNDTRLDTEDERLWIVTGPNMAGKSTLMRQVATCCILAQMGSFVPAQRAQIGVVDRVLSRVGASDNLARGESTFMVEMRETATILRDATRRSLVILDEIGRGTSTFDGLAIAWAVAEHLYAAIGCRAMFATHYHQLTELAEHHGGVANYSVSAREHEGDVVFLHRLTPGAVSKSYGIAVARLAGLPESVLGRAGAVLESLEEDVPVAGGPGTARREPPAPQLDLFTRPKVPMCTETEKAALLQLANVELDRMTPLEALQLLASLKEAIAEDET